MVTRSVLQVAGQCGAGSPARRRGNFLLRGQKKVTKEEALNRTPVPQAKHSARKQTPQGAHTRPASLSLLSLSPAPSITPPARLTSAARRTHQNSPRKRRSGAATMAPSPLRRRPSDAAFVFAREPGVQPALTVVKPRFIVLVIGTAARAKRVASARDDAGRFRAPLVAPRSSCAVQRLFFGDFLLAPQKKVTAPPGAHPGTTLATNQKYRAAS
jgi:hypothetical protein